MDLIYGLPQMAMTEWNEQLDQPFSFQPPHLSSYLSYCRSEDHAGPSSCKPADVVMPATMRPGRAVRAADRARGTGRMVQYEISNFGKQGHFSPPQHQLLEGCALPGHRTECAFVRWSRTRGGTLRTTSVYALAGWTKGERYWQERDADPTQVTNER
jgi:coproporphyrinogen III oxidase-like Fe-S oxidoreductase